ncbi:MAG: response regulator transcription factor [Chloroflexota bacterium]
MSSPIRVLLADDHAVVRKGIREFLETDANVMVSAEAADGLAALRLIRERRPDVAVLDIQMPGQSGIEVTRAIRAERLPVGVLILTAFDDPPYVKAVLQAGANGYVLKTADAQEIVAAIHAVYEGQSVLDRAIVGKVMAQLVEPETHPTGGYVESLTDRELEVLRLAAKGYTNKAIAVELSISDRTVQGHLAKIYAKLNVASRTEAVMRGVALGWIPPTIGEPA